MGAILPLTGVVAHFGKPLKEGIELAVHQLGTEKLEIIFEDDQSINRTATVTAAKRLIEVEKVPVIFDTAVNTMGAIAPLLNRTKTLGIVLWDSNKQLENFGDYVFGFGYSTEAAGEDMATYAYKALNLRNIAVIGAVDEWSELISGSFERRFTALGGMIAFSEKVDIDAADIKPLILRAKQKNTDGMYAPLISRSLTNWISQTQELHYKGARLTGDALGDAEIAEAGAQNTEGLFVTQFWLDDPNFTELYHQHFSSVSGGVNYGFVALGYDAVMCLYNIASRQHPFTRENSLSIVRNSQCSGVSGVTDFRQGRLSSRRERILHVSEGKFSPVKNMEAR